MDEIVFTILDSYFDGQKMHVGAYANETHPNHKEVFTSTFVDVDSPSHINYNVLEELYLETFGDVSDTHIMQISSPHQFPII